jgi:hypothetical protein
MIFDHRKNTHSQLHTHIHLFPLSYYISQGTKDGDDDVKKIKDDDKEIDIDNDEEGGKDDDITHNDDGDDD